jgi:hypothetical protein
MSAIRRTIPAKSVWHLRAFKNPDLHNSSNKLRICV